MKKILLLVLLFVFIFAIIADEEEAPKKTIEDQRRDTMRFGTDTEITTLIQALISEKVDYLDNEIIEIANITKNRGILTGAFNFFNEMEKNGLEERAIRAVTGRDDEANETILAAVNYLGKVKAKVATDSLKDLINNGENRFLNNALRALGRTGGGEHSSDTAYFLLDHYNDKNPNDETKREIVIAMGEAGSISSIPFLSDLVNNADERAPLRMAALDALSKIGDEEGLDAIVNAVSSSDPNVRSTAIAALAPFSGTDVDNAILEAFRDSYYRTRIGAASAAGIRRLDSAIPFLRYRAENDEVPAVKDEAIKALGAINNSETMEILDSLFAERKNSDRVRLVAGEMLLQNNADIYGPKVLIEMEEAKAKNQTPLYNGFIRIMGIAKSSVMEGIAKNFVLSGGVIEKSLALDLILNNEFRGLAEEVRSLLDEKKYGASVARKAQNTLDKLGLN